MKFKRKTRRHIMAMLITQGRPVRPPSGYARARSSPRSARSHTAKTLRERRDHLRHGLAQYFALRTRGCVLLYLCNFYLVLLICICAYLLLIFIDVIISIHYLCSFSLRNYFITYIENKLEDLIP